MSPFQATSANDGQPPQPDSATHGAGAVGGQVVDVDYDRDVISVLLDDGRERTFPFPLFDGGDVYRPGQRFLLALSPSGQPREVALEEAPTNLPTRTASGYVESVDPEDQVAWVYLRGEEGWHRKVMPLRLLEDNDLARPGHHFLLDMSDDGTPIALRPDEDELEMMPRPSEQVKPRWTIRPAAEADHS